MIVLGRFMFPNCPVWKGITDNNLSVIVIKTFIKKEKKIVTKAVCNPWATQYGKPKTICANLIISFFFYSV
jgi:hypothetical protein